MANFRKFGKSDNEGSRENRTDRPSPRPSNDRDRGDSNRKFNRDDKPSFSRVDRRDDRRDSGRGDSRPSFNRDNDRRDSGRGDSRPSFNRDNDRRDSGRVDSRPSFNRGSDRRDSGRNDSRPSFNRGSDRRDSGRGDSRPSYDRGSDRRDSGRGDSRPPFNRDNDRRNSGRGDSRPSFNRDNDRRDSGRGDSRPSFDRGSERRDSGRGDSRPSYDRGSDRRGDSRPPFNRDNDRGDSRPSYDRGGDRRDAGRGDSRPSFNRDDRGEERHFRKPPTGKGKTEKSGFSREERPRKGRPEITAFKPNLDRQVGPERPPRYDAAALKSKAPERIKEKIMEDAPSKEEEIRLNKYIANAGLCSRREADELIESGTIKVNGKVVTEMGYKVKDSDTIKYGKDVLNRERMMYILLNKPKDFITTMDDPKERKTVMDLVGGACKERVYPVGRLDRNTTGLLLLTNDGELTEKLTHPTNDIKKIYQAELDKPITTEHFEAIKEGIELEDGFVKPDELALVTPDAFVVGIEIHSGKNRIVRRIFENFGYEVTKLDRTTFAGLTKKDLPRGKWRFLNEKELIRLKYMI